MEDVIVSEQKDKPVFDEETLTKLLEAAYVLQEHSHELRAAQAQLGDTVEAEAEKHATAAPEQPEKKSDEEAANPFLKPSEGSAAKAPDPVDKPDYDATLAQVAEVQHQVEVGHLKANAAMVLIAEQIIEICGAAGAAVGTSNGKQISYVAVAGIRTLPVGSSVPQEKAFCFPCVRTGQVFACKDTSGELLIDAAECRRRGIGSFIAVPVFGNAGIAGGLELYYSDPGAFGEHDIQTCQLMAAIITDVLARDAKSIGGNGSAVLDRVPGQKTVPGAEVSSSVRCYKCGNQLLGEEQFCGECGAPRSVEPEPLGVQSKVSSLWQTQKSSAGIHATTGEKLAENGLRRMTDSPSFAAELPADVREMLEAMANAPDEELRDREPDPEAAPEQQFNSIATETPETPEPANSGHWTSALTAREFLEQVAGGNRRSWLPKFWNQHRGDIYLAVAILLVVCVVGWGLWSNHPVNATTTAVPAPKPAETRKPAVQQLSLFDRMLLSLGLADPPETPEDKGNPATAVWVDLKTGLYYCPGTELYGKTPRGKYTSQRDAQLDEFAPAYRKACD